MGPIPNLVLGWTQAGVLALLPVLAAVRPALAPLAAALAAGLEPLVRRSRAAEPWALALPVLASLVVLGAAAGATVAGGWFALAVVVAAAARFLPTRGAARPDAADLAALLGWAGAFLLRPQQLLPAGGGFVAPAVLLLAAARLGRGLPRSPAPGRGAAPEPPSREVRGTLSLRGVVLAGADGMARSVPLDLDLRAGDSLAVLCDTPTEVEALAAAVAGRRRPQAGEVVVDGVPLAHGDRLVTVVAEGESFVPGGLEENLAALCPRPLPADTLAAVWEACALEEVASALAGRSLSADGAPLDPFHRMLLLAARVIPSDYRLVVVVDPMPWLNAVRRELWRAALVRAAVGRTVIWLTADRELARRATGVVELRSGALRQVKE